MSRRAKHHAHPDPAAWPSPGVGPRGGGFTLGSLAWAAFLVVSAFAGTQPVHAQQQATPAASAAARDYDLPDGPLDATLGRFAAESGVLLSADAALTRGKHAPALKGRFDVESGFAALLASHGLQAVRSDSGVFLLRALPPGPGRSVREIRLGTLTVTARRDPVGEMYETPASVAVVTQEEIARLPPRNASDVLRDVSGVYSSQGRSDPGLAVNIRGLQDFGRVNVMIDGARQNFQFSGHGANGKVYVDPALIGGVNVQKGPTSTVGGAGMIAGLVNFRTLEIDDVVAAGATRGGQVTGSTGSNGYHFSGSTSVGLRASDQVDLVAAISRKHVGAFRLGTHGASEQSDESNRVGWTTRSTGQDQWSGLFKTRWQLAPGHQLKLGYLGLNADFSNGGGGNTTDATSEMSTSASQRFKVHADTLTLGYEWRPASDWLAVDAGLYYNRTKRREARENYYADADGGQGAFSVAYQTETVGGSVQNTARLPGRWFDTIWVAGGEFFHDWTDPTFQRNADSTYEDHWFTGATPQGKRTVASGFSELTLDYRDTVQLIGGLRYDWYTLSGGGNMYVGAIRNPGGVRPPVTNIFTNFDVDRHASALSPKLTLAYKPVRQLQLYTSYGKGMRPPAISESLMYGMHSGNMFPYFPAPNLKEERSTNWEVGANVNFDDVLKHGDRLRMKTAWFNNRVQNYITSAAIMMPTATTSCTGILCPSGHVNLLDPARFQGLEFDLDYDAGPVFAKFNATRVQADMGARRYDPFPLGSWVGYPATDMGSGSQNGAVGMDGLFYSGPPKLKLSLSGGVRLFERKLELGARMRIEKPSGQETFALHAPARRIQTYDLWAAWQVNPSLLLRLAVDNVTDRNYLELAGTGGSYTYGPGRTAIATAQWRF